MEWHGLCVCVRVGRDHEPGKSNLTDQDSVWRQTCMDPRNHVLDRGAYWCNLGKYNGSIFEAAVMQPAVGDAHRMGRIIS